MRSVLGFASVVWPKSLSTYIYNLGTIQYKLLKRIAYMNNLFNSRSSLISMQNVVNLDSLAYIKMSINKYYVRFIKL